MVADQWIEAVTALDVFGNRMAICERCHAGLIRSRAQSFKKDKEEFVDVELPREFWWATGHAALDQNWETGDFSTWIDRMRHWRAYGVCFALNDLLELVPFERRAETRRRLSVSGNPAWVSAREARRFAYEQAGLQPVAAGKAVIEKCRLGFITAQAVEKRWGAGDDPGVWTTKAREWDIPTWFWENLATEATNSIDWERGMFAAPGRGPSGYGWTTLIDVHFLTSSLVSLLPSVPVPAEDQDGQGDSRKPNLPEADLRRWWDRLLSVREALSQSQLWALAKSDNPQHTISRERIRTLTEGRAPGPKSS